uniref:RNA-directed DNA polymerase n=1 Tax=Tanacetum cinerariifolium TaxID=118510 RepID=A0A6L2MY26_TANCI|nr:hypothetical protein [Tanacetum cinerariifolium]
MADNRTMAQLLQVPTEGYEDAIVIPEIIANNFELKHGLINLVQNKQFFGHDKEDPHAHIRYFNKITSTMRVPNFFPPSKTTNLRNKITRFQQRFDESFSEAWDHFNDLLRACPHHGFFELHQLDTFYNALNVNDQDSLNSAAGVNFLDKMPSACLKIIESKSKDMVRALLLDKKNQSSAPAPSLTPAQVKSFEPNCVTCGGTHSYQNCPATSGNVYRDNIQEYVSQAAAANYNQGNTGSGTLPSNTVTNPKEDLKGITTGSGVAYQGPTIPTRSKVVKQGTEVTKDQVQTPSSLSTAPVQPLVVQSETQASVFKPSQLLLPKPQDLGKFLIPCEFPGMDECLALADLGASINLMPLSVWEGISLPELTPTCMTLKLADHSVSKPIGIAKDVLVKAKLTLRIRNEAITYNLDQTSRYSANYNQMTANKIEVIDIACEDYSQKVLDFSDVTASGNPTPYDDPIVSTTSPTLTPFGDSDFLLFEEADAFLAILNSEPLPPIPNHEQYMPSFKKELKVCEANTVKSSIDEPLEVELKDLPPHLEYVFLEGDNKFPGINAEFYTRKILMEEDYKPAVQHQRRVNPKIHGVIKKEVEKLLDAALIYPISDSPWVSPIHCVPKKGGFTIIENEENELIPTRLEKTTFTCPYEMFAYRRMPFGLCNASDTFQRYKMLQRCEDTNLCLNWEKSHFMVKEGIVLGHKISKNGIEVDKAKVDVITKLPHPTTVKEKEMLDVVYAFEKFWSYLIMNKSIVHTDHFALKYLFSKKDAKVRLLWWVLLLQEFDFKVLDMKGVENHATDHLSRLENPYENVLDPKEINETFPLETLSMVTFRGDSSTPWFADFANYHAGNFIVKAKALPTNDARVVCKFLKSLFAKFGAPRAIISDRGTHFCNNQLAKVMLKYGVTHRLSIAYHPQTSRQVKVSNLGLKRILGRTIGQNHASWSDKLDDAL